MVVLYKVAYGTTSQTVQSQRARWRMPMRSGAADQPPRVAERPGEGALEPPKFPAGYESAIRAGEAGLARRFPDVLTWFGHRTLQWWALPGRGDARGLVGASSAEELAQLLAAMAAARRSPPAPGDDPGHRRAGSRHQQRGAGIRSRIQPADRTILPVTDLAAAQPQA
jgi:hypothetical protein